MVIDLKAEWRLIDWSSLVWSLFDSYAGWIDISFRNKSKKEADPEDVRDEQQTKRDDQHPCLFWLDPERHFYMTTISSSSQLRNSSIERFFHYFWETKHSCLQGSLNSDTKSSLNKWANESCTL